MTGHLRGDARKRAEQPRDDLAARIVHRLSCVRCAQGWSCGGPGEGDYAAAGEIAGLLAEVRGEERERVAQADSEIAGPLAEWLCELLGDPRALVSGEVWAGLTAVRARIARTEAGS